LKVVAAGIVAAVPMCTESRVKLEAQCLNKQSPWGRFKW